MQNGRPERATSGVAVKRPSARTAPDRAGVLAMRTSISEPPSAVAMASAMPSAMSRAWPVAGMPVVDVTTARTHCAVGDVFDVPG